MKRKISPGLYKYYKMLEIFLENSLFKLFSCMGKKWKLNISLKNRSSSDFAYGFVGFLSK